MTNKTVTKVEPNLRLESIFRHYNIGIYARVSTGSTEQLHSLGTQVSAFMKPPPFNSVQPIRIHSQRSVISSRSATD